MKKVIFLLLMFLLIAGNAWAAGSSCSISVSDPDTSGVQLYTWTLTSDDATGAVTCGAIKVVGYIVLVETDPDGTAAPTTLYDITMTGPLGNDIAGGLLINRSATVTEPMIFQINSLNVPFHINGAVIVAGTAMGNSKITRVIAHVQR